MYICFDVNNSEEANKGFAVNELKKTSAKMRGIIKIHLKNL